MHMSPISRSSHKDPAQCDVLQTLWQKVRALVILFEYLSGFVVAVVETNVPTFLPRFKSGSCRRHIENFPQRPEFGLVGKKLTPTVASFSWCRFVDALEKIEAEDVHRFPTYGTVFNNHWLYRFSVFPVEVFGGYVLNLVYGSNMFTYVTSFRLSKGWPSDLVKTLKSEIVAIKLKL